MKIACSMRPKWTLALTKNMYISIAFFCLMLFMVLSCRKNDSAGKLLHISLLNLNSSVRSYSVMAVFRPTNSSCDQDHPTSRLCRNSFSKARKGHHGSEEFDLQLPLRQNGIMTIDINAASAECGTAQFGQVMIQMDESIRDSAATIILKDCDSCWCRYCQGTNCGPPGGPPLNDIKGASEKDIWAVGDHGTLLHWDGSTWNKENSNTRRDITALYVINKDDVWAVGGSFGNIPDEPKVGIIIHWNGKNWSKITDGVDALLYGIWPISTETLALAGGCGRSRKNCAYWANLSTKDYTLRKESASSDVGQIHSIWRYGSSESIWAVGGDGPAGVLTPEERCPIDGKKYGRIFRKSDQQQQWSDVAVESSEQLCNLNWIWGSAADDIWAVGDYGSIMHSDGKTWKKIPNSAIPELRNYWNVWGTSRTDVWAVGGSMLRAKPAGAGRGLIIHWNGASWTKVPTFEHEVNGGRDTYLNSIWGASGDDIWAVGYGGVIYRHRR